MILVVDLTNRRLHLDTACQMSWLATFISPIESDIECFVLHSIGDWEIFDKIPRHAVKHIDWSNVQNLRFPTSYQCLTFRQNNRL